MKAHQTGLIGAVPETSPLSFQHLHDVQQGLELGLLRNLLNFNVADAALSLGRGRSSQAVADALTMSRRRAVRRFRT